MPTPPIKAPAGREGPFCMERPSLPCRYQPGEKVQLLCEGQAPRRARVEAVLFFADRVRYVLRFGGGLAHADPAHILPLPE